MKEKKRLYFSHDFKRDALVLYAGGLSAKDVFLKLGINISSLEKNDKKYASKLINKWKNEVYSNKEILYLLSCNLENKRLISEIEAIRENAKSTFYEKDFCAEIKKYINLKISKNFKISD